MNDAIEKDVKRALETLAFFLRLSGKSRQELDREIGQGRGFTSQVLTGRVKLRFDHVVQLLQGVNADSSRYFGLLYPVAEKDREPLRELQKMFEQFKKETAKPKAEPEPPRERLVDPKELDRLVQEKVEQILEARRRKPRRRRS
jgi:hypothetical protein